MSKAASRLAMESYEPVFVARQPIFTPELRVWGYELLFRHQHATSASVVDGDLATARVIADGYALVREGMQSSRKLLVNFPAGSILGGSARALPCDRVVIEILETVEPDPEILDACRRLKADGYLLALDDFVGQPGFEPLLELADIVKVDVLGMTPERIEAIFASLQRDGAQLLAEKVENRAVFEHTRELGFSLFQGYFFSRPEVVPGRKITTSQLSRLRLLAEISDPRIDVAGLARIVGSDPGLSHRLLRHLGSAAFGRRGPVRSISQAALCLGRVALTQWLRVVLVSDLGTTPVSREAASLAMQRARFLQQLAGVSRVRSESADSLFMLGLLSLVDAMLGLPMEDVCNELPLHPRHRAALCGEASPTRAWLDLVNALERAEWSVAMTLLEDVGVAPDQASRMYTEAHAWADTMTTAAAR